MDEARLQLRAFQRVLRAYCAAFLKHAEDPENAAYRNEFVAAIHTLEGEVNSAMDFHSLGEALKELWAFIQDENVWFPRDFMPAWQQFEVVRSAADKYDLDLINWIRFRTEL